MYKNKEARKKYREKNKVAIAEASKIYYQKNKVVILERNKNYYKENSVTITEYKLKTRFGITLDEYTQLLEKQNFCCAICSRHSDEFTKALYVDHDHTTGIVRGLLCQKCNSALGFLNDSVETIKRALDYLEKSRD